MTLHRFPKPSLSAPEFARMLGCDVHLVRARIDAGTMPGSRQGRNYLIPREAAELFMKLGKVVSPEELAAPLRASDLVQRRKTA